MLGYEQLIIITPRIINVTKIISLCHLNNNRGSDLATNGVCKEQQ